MMFLLRNLCAMMLVLVSSTVAAKADSLKGMVEVELAAYAGAALPPGATISIVDMTPVRGHVETVVIRRFNPQNGYFEASIANGAISRPITGRAQAFVLLYAPVRAIRPGEKVSPDNFSLVKTPVSHVPADAVENLAMIEGFEARRSMAAGRPISMQWLGAPFVVARNDIVTVTYDSDHIRLTARARALEDGAVGDVIRAMQIDGKSVIQGQVSGPKAISVN